MERPLLTRFPLFALVLLAGPLAGCPTDPPAGDTGPLTFADCEAIVEACHDVDNGSGGMATTCHDTAHDATSNADCAPLRASCVAACQAIDGGVVHDEDAGAHAHDEDAPGHAH